MMLKRIPCLPRYTNNNRLKTNGDASDTNKQLTRNPSHIIMLSNHVKLRVTEFHRKTVNKPLLSYRKQRFLSLVTCTALIYRLAGHMTWLHAWLADWRTSWGVGWTRSHIYTYVGGGWHLGTNITVVISILKKNSRENELGKRADAFRSKPSPVHSANKNIWR